jgi:hypothetical protein
VFYEVLTASSTQLNNMMMTFSIKILNREGVLPLHLLHDLERCRIPFREAGDISAYISVQLLQLTLILLVSPIKINYHD